MLKLAESPSGLEAQKSLRQAILQLTQPKFLINLRLVILKVLALKPDLLMDMHWPDTPFALAHLNRFTGSAYPLQLNGLILLDLENLIQDLHLLNRSALKDVLLDGILLRPVRKLRQSEILLRIRIILIFILIIATMLLMNARSIIISA